MSYIDFVTIQLFETFLFRIVLTVILVPLLLVHL